MDLGIAHGIKVARNVLVISHFFFFADDHIIFVRATNEQASYIFSSILKAYEKFFWSKSELE